MLALLIYCSVSKASDPNTPQAQSSKQKFAVEATFSTSDWCQPGSTEFWIEDSLPKPVRYYKIIVVNKYGKIIFQEEFGTVKAYGTERHFVTFYEAPNQIKVAADRDIWNLKKDHDLKILIVEKNLLERIMNVVTPQPKNKYWDGKTSIYNKQAINKKVNGLVFL